MPATACLLCPVYRPDAKPQLPEPELFPVCGRDRQRLDADLAALPSLHDRLRNPDLMTGDERRMFQVDWNKQGQRAWNTLPAGPMKGHTNQPTVSGSHPDQIPVNLGVVDLTSHARGTNITAAGREHPEDHIGRLSVGTLLDSWVQAWRDELFPDQHRPPARVDELVRWLRTHVDVACTKSSAIAEFAAEIRSIRGAMHAALGEVNAEPDVKVGVRCPNDKCDAVSTLVQRPGEFWIECEACGALVEPEDYKAWVRRWGQYEHSQRSPEELRELMRS